MFSPSLSVLRANRSDTGRRRFSLERLEPRLPLAGQLVINEFMASNEGGLRDGNGESSDWIEIANFGEVPVDLAGYRLTDNPRVLDKWVFPGRTIGPGELLIVFASGQRDGLVVDSAGHLHTNFKLSSQGEYLALVAPDGRVVSEFGPEGTTYPPQRANVSYGRGTTTGNEPAAIGYLASSSPAAPNVPNEQVFAGLVQDVKPSVERGYFDAPFLLQLTTTTPGAVIRYTTDGSWPTPDTGQLYTGPFTVGKTTTLRARAFRPGYMPSPVVTHTYIFLDDVLVQDGAGLPQTWGTFVFGSTEARQGTPVPANYEMDPEVVHDPRYRDTIKNDLRSLPVVSLVMDPVDLWDEQRGIYSNTLEEGIEWERPVSVELMDEAGRTQFSIDGGIRIHGGFGRRPSATAKHSFRLLLKSDYGPAKLRFPWFGSDQVSTFDTLVLRANYNYSWARGNRGGEQTGKDYTLVTDRWASVAHGEMGALAANGSFVHLYLNGLYWGVYNPNERPDASFQAEHRGGRKEDYDVVTHEGLADGSRDSWNELMRIIRRRPIDYAAVDQILDIDNFIDYMILNQFGGNGDWPQNNWYASRRRMDGEKWQFHAWDSEFFFINLNHDRINDLPSEGPGLILRQLMTVDAFRVRFGDRVHRHLFNDGVLTPERNIARLDALAAIVERAVVGESARWGDAWMNQVSPPRTRDDDWLPRLEQLRTQYFPRRNDIVVRQYQRRGLYPQVPAPQYNQHGGDVPAGFTLEMTAADPADTIFYTLDGSDPRTADGAVSQSAQPYRSPLPLRESAVVRARVLRDGQWSALNEASFRIWATRGDLDRNGSVDAADISLLCQAIRTGESRNELDLNQDGQVDRTDHSTLIHDVLETHFGDSNLDGRFNSTDLVLIFQRGEFEDAVAGNSTWISGDWNCDGEFTAADLVLAFQEGGYSLV